jgi:hypothetical protein
MASLNDTLTVGLILILLFGAVSLYLYTCIQQCEQKLNLVESILLDIKMSAEIREYPEMVLPKSNGNNSHNSHSSHGSSKAGVDVNESDLYKSALEEAHLEELASPLPTDVPEVAPEAAAPVPPPESVPSSSASVAPTPNYESMTLVELKALAKQRSISGVSSMKRSQILEALRTSDKPASAAAAASLGGGLSPFLDSATSLEGEGLDGVELLASQ